MCALQSSLPPHLREAILSSMVAAEVEEGQQQQVSEVGDGDLEEIEAGDNGALFVSNSILYQVETIENNTVTAIPFGVNSDNIMLSRRECANLVEQFVNRNL